MHALVIVNVPCMPYDYSFTLTKRTRRMLKRLIDDGNLSKSNEACGDV